LSELGKRLVTRQTGPGGQWLSFTVVSAQTANRSTARLRKPRGRSRAGARLRCRASAGKPGNTRQKGDNLLIWLKEYFFIL
jgi:hypothetical protein